MKEHIKLIRALIKEVIEAEENEIIETPKNTLHLYEGDVELNLEDTIKYPEELRNSLLTIPQKFSDWNKEISWKKKTLEDPKDPELDPFTPSDVQRQDYFDQLREKTLKGLGDNIGKGSSRIVYAVGTDKVLKLALSVQGLAQNKAEVKVFKKVGTAPNPLVAQITDYDKYYRWIEVEKALSSNSDIPTDELNEAFKNVSGVYFDDFFYCAYGRFSVPAIMFDLAETDPAFLTTNYDQIPKSELKEISTKAFNFSKEIEHLTKSSGLVYADIRRASAWGTVQRNGQPVPIMVDYGYTKDVQNKYY
jgi:hypothetical protein